MCRGEEGSARLSEPVCCYKRSSEAGVLPSFLVTDTLRFAFLPEQTTNRVGESMLPYPQKDKRKPVQSQMKGES